MTDITPDKLDQARKWAEGGFDQAYIHDGPRAAAELIQSLPDEWIDANKLRETIEFHRDRLPHGAEEDLEALLPTRRPRTLADMTPEERKEYHWCLVETPLNEGLFIKQYDTTAFVIYLNGEHRFWSLDRVTPLPDLPRMAWPNEHWLPSDEEQAAEETPTPPRPEDVPEGEFWLVEFDGKQDTAVRDLPGTEYPWWLMRGYRVSDKNITLVSRMVPEVKA